MLPTGKRVPRKGDEDADRKGKGKVVDVEERRKSERLRTRRRKVEMVLRCAQEGGRR